jgi:hypothetical protein
MRAQGGGTPHLVVLTPDADRGRRIPVNKDNLVVGRGQTCDVRFDDPRVSRTHAVLRRRGNAVYIEDLGSSAGTFVNGVTTGTVRELRAGDLLTFASVTARLESGVFGSDQQRAEVIHYDERRYNSHVQHVNQQRENFLREVAATGTKARWLVWMGFVMFVVGYGIFAAVDLNLLKQVSTGIQNPGSGPPTDPSEWSVGGIPIGLIGWTLAAAGTLLLIVGIVLHIVATSRHKQAYQAFPALPPWQGPSS